MTAGCLPNLAAKLKEWSRGKITALPPKVVAIDSTELITNPPPFLFFTGHRDFHLTSAEIQNLQKYVQIGGAIWGDSAFAGDGSRFDVAFHREMKRVLPDDNIQFQPLDANHEIFTGSLFRFEKSPAGLNYRSDPIEIMNIYGKLAVIYTPNDYSDMMTMVLQPGTDEREAKPDNRNHPSANHPLFTPGGFVSHEGVYFRNYKADSAMSVYKLSDNILVHLLHRFDAASELTP